MKLRIGIAATIGFLLPVFFGFVAVSLFSNRASNFWIDTALRIPCALSGLALERPLSTWWYLSPLTNAALYGAIAYIWFRGRAAYSI